MPFTILHNPRCSKSRNTLALLNENGIEPEVVEYLQTPPTPAELAIILNKLGLSADAVIRKNETEYKEAGTAVQNMDEGARIAWLCQNPKALQRPIVVTESAACIGRPPENVLELINS
jgi:arsenate reductase